MKGDKEGELHQASRSSSWRGEEVTYRGEGLLSRKKKKRELNLENLYKEKEEKLRSKNKGEDKGNLMTKKKKGGNHYLTICVDDSQKEKSRIESTSMGK